MTRGHSYAEDAALGQSVITLPATGAACTPLAVPSQEVGAETRPQGLRDGSGIS